MKGKGELAREMTAKSRLSNAMLLTRVVLGLVPTVLVIYLVHLFLDGTLSPLAIACAAVAMAACVAGKAACMFAATWKAHRVAYSYLTDIRLRIVRHLKKSLSASFKSEGQGTSRTSCATTWSRWRYTLPTGYLKRPRPPSFPPPHSSLCSQWTGGSLCACWRACLSCGS